MSPLFVFLLFFFKSNQVKNKSLLAAEGRCYLAGKVTQQAYNNSRLGHRHQTGAQTVFKSKVTATVFTNSSANPGGVKGKDSPEEEGRRGTEPVLGKIINLKVFLRLSQ